MPFGMVQPGPDCNDTDWNYTSGYQYGDTTVLGFSQTHLNGTGIGELGDILILPFSGKTGRGVMDKRTEASSPGYYTVTLKDGVKVELTCTERVAFHRYTFPEKEGYVLVDFRHGIRFLTDSLVLDSDIRMVDGHSIEGFCHTRNWVERKYFFRMEFDRPYTVADTVSEKEDKAPAYSLSFVLGRDRCLNVKVALSATGLEGARKNMAAEASDVDFEEMRRAASDAWECLLGRVEVKGNDSVLTNFYTALYHLMLQPSDIADAGDRPYYSTFSNWDIYRAAFPLLQIIVPERIGDMVQSMLDVHEKQGFLPIWTVWDADNYCMIGNHAIPMVVSACVNGFGGFSVNDAYDAVKETSVRPHIHSEWDLYEKYGYFPYDLMPLESVSKTLENGYDDWCVSLLASMTGDTLAAEHFKERSGYWKNLYDRESGLMRGKDARGNWRTPFDPLTATSPMNNPGDYTEANAWQYFWTPAQHDIEALRDLLGGPSALGDMLDRFFSIEAVNPDKYLGQEAMIGQYAHGNEPCHHIAYLYAWSDRPWRAAGIIREICRDFYRPEPGGLTGNDDYGQMSAWYVLSMCGFYPVNPATGDFVFGVPQLEEVVFDVGDGKSFRITADGLYGNDCIIHSMSLNGMEYNDFKINYRDIMKGGTFEYHMAESGPSEPFGLVMFGSITPEGWLKDRMAGDLKGLASDLPDLIPELMNDPIYGNGRLDRSSKAKDLGNSREGDSEGDEQYKWWNSETQSNWLDGFVRNALLIRDSAALEEAKARIYAMLGTQDPDGYIGIYTPSLRYDFNLENGELWAKATLYRAFLGYWEATGDDKVWNAILKAVDNVMDNWPAWKSHPFDAGKEYNGGAAHGLVFTDVLERLYQLTGDNRYRDYALFLYREYSSSFSWESDAQYVNVMDSAYRLRCHGVHTYEHIRPLAVAAAYDRTLVPALEKYLEKVAKCVTVTGGPIGDEWIGGRYADAGETGYEYCSMHELVDSYGMLLQKTGDLHYAEMMETIFFNAAAGARHPEYPAIAYLKTDNSYEMHNNRRYKYSPVHQDVAVCCVPNALRISPYFLRYAWMQDNTGVPVALLLVPCSADFAWKDHKISVRVETDYPESLSFRMHFSGDTVFPVRIRIPEWTEKVRTRSEYSVMDGYAEFEAVPGETLEFSFDASERVVAGPDGYNYFAMGPLFYALPVEGEEIPGRVYGEGYRDYEYRSSGYEGYSFCQDCDAVYSGGSMTVSLLDMKNGERVRKTLIPMKETVLRQCGFKRQD